VVGNKTADKEAKKATKEGSSPTGNPPPALQKALPISIHTAKRQHMAQLKSEWNREWAKLQQKPWFALIDSEFPFTKHGVMVSMLT
ncbi:hypothetical protein B0H34DRAFT_657559, partial [Crassisporium funariophilum]